MEPLNRATIVIQRQNEENEDTNAQKKSTQNS